MTIQSNSLLVGDMGQMLVLKTNWHIDKNNCDQIVSFCLPVNHGCGLVAISFHSLPAVTASRSTPHPTLHPTLHPSLTPTPSTPSPGNNCIHILTLAPKKVKAVFLFRISLQNQLVVPMVSGPRMITFSLDNRRAW